MESPVGCSILDFLAMCHLVKEAETAEVYSRNEHPIFTCFVDLAKLKHLIPSTLILNLPLLVYKF